MAAAAAAPSSPAGRLCTSPSTITPASPSPACCPTNKAKPPSPSCTPLLLSTPNTASPFADCSPTTAPAIAPATSALLASNSASCTASPALTRRAPTARRNASSKPPCASGLTFATTSIQKNVISSFRPGSSITTSTVRMVVSVTLRPSAACLRWVQRLDRSQLAQPFLHSNPRGRPLLSRRLRQGGDFDLNELRMPSQIPVLSPQAAAIDC